MNHIATSIQDYSYSNREINKVNSIAIVKKNRNDIKKGEAEAIIASLNDLIQDPKYKPYFFSRLYLLGKPRFLELAHRARKYGTDKPRYFVHLLNA